MSPAILAQLDNEERTCRLHGLLRTWMRNGMAMLNWKGQDKVLPFSDGHLSSACSGAGFEAC